MLKFANKSAWISTGARYVRFIRFLLAGGIAAAVNIVSRFLLTPLLGFEVSVAVAYVIGMLVAFQLFRYLVFDRSNLSTGEESKRFIVVNIIALVLVWGISVLLARLVFPALDFTWHAQDIAHLIAVCVPAISSYLGHSRYTFRNS